MRLLIKKIFAACRIPTLFLVVLFSALAPSILLAQTLAGPFTPLVGIPGIDPDAEFNEYINALYLLSISLGALLAVVKIIIAGVKWMLTDLISGKEDAKKDIQGALTGLLIIISAVLILTVINPKLVDFELNFGSISDTSSGGGGNSGTGTISASGCVVPLGQSDCMSNVIWSTTGVTTPTITHNGESFSTAISGNISRNISPGIRHNFVILNGTAQIATVSRQASCAPGSTWNGSICRSGGGGNSGTGTISATGCLVQIGLSGCQGSVTWNTNGVTTPTIRHNTAIISTAPSGNGFTAPMGGTITFNNFVIFSGNTPVASTTVISGCVTGSSWNGSVCSDVGNIGTGSIRASDCVVPIGERNCQSNLTWNTTGVTTPHIRHNFRLISTNASSNGFPWDISPGAPQFNSFSISTGSNLNSSIIIASGYAQAICAPGSTFIDGVCRGSGGGGNTGTGTISATNCVIPLGQSNCVSNVTWTTTGVTAPTIRHNN